jgi:Tfp pilus assembly protein PilF
MDRRTVIRHAWMIAICAFISACSHSPTREQTEQMRLSRQADSNYQSGKFDAARKQYETLVQTNPRFAIGYVRLGVIAYRAGETESARSSFESALKADPRNTQATYNLAMLHLNDAAKLLDSYMTISPPPAQRDEVRILIAQLKAFGKQ